MIVRGREEFEAEKLTPKLPCCGTLAFVDFEGESSVPVDNLNLDELIRRQRAWLSVVTAIYAKPFLSLP